MQILIRASEEQKSILLAKPILPDTMLLWFDDNITKADAYIDLLFEDEGSIFDAIKDKPVIVSSVIETCENLPSNFCRINAWNSFLEKEKLEAATLNNAMKPQFENTIKQLGYEVYFVNDIVGLIASRAIAMIINEAYFGLEDEISTKEQIDTAMKLGTNYPYGPFEWANKIGVRKVELLLQALYKTDDRYKPCELLIRESSN